MFVYFCERNKKDQVIKRLPVPSPGRLQIVGAGVTIEKKTDITGESVRRVGDSGTDHGQSSALNISDQYPSRNCSTGADRIQLSCGGSMLM